MCFAFGTLIAQSAELILYPWHEPIAALRYGEIGFGFLAAAVMVYIIVELVFSGALRVEEGTIREAQVKKWTKS